MCNQKPTGSQFSLLHEPNEKVNGKTKKKTIEQSGVRKCSLMEEWGLWRDGFNNNNNNNK